MLKPIYLLTVLSTLIVAGSCQDYADECPDKDGFYADAIQCDRYYECRDGQISDKVCPDGLVFDETSIQFAKCSFPFSIDCSSRNELQPAKPTELCPRQNGYFPHEDPKVCDKFYFCVDGIANPITCPSSLIFEPKRGQCAYSDQVERKGCSSQEVFNFQCPDGANSPHEHPRFPDPTDCQFFYICIGGVNPRRNGCTVGLVFNKETFACEAPQKVNDECRTWYNETFLESLRANRPPPPLGVKIAGNRKRVKVVKKGGQRVQPGGQRVQPGGQRVQPGGQRVQPGGQNIPSNFRNPFDKRVRTRVTTPAPAAPPPRQPPASHFALTDDEAIQRFRDSHRFGSQTGNSRLTVLDNPSRPLPQIDRVEEVPERDRPFTHFRQRPIPITLE